MINFPINKKFIFTYEYAYTIELRHVGRPDILAKDLFESVIYYKPICEYNNIRMPVSTKYGIRPNSELLYNTNTIIETDDEWESYFDDIGGVIDQLSLGTLILVPTLESANEYLLRYGK